MKQLKLRTEVLEQHAQLLGLTVKDKVTGFKGVVTSVSFDLYGCVQATVDAGFDKRGDRTAHWLDVARLTPTGDKRVMDLPEHLMEAKPPQRERGPADKPSVGR